MKVLFTICCALIISLVLLSSCSSDKVASSSFIQKKKYSKGYTFHFVSRKNKPEVIKQEITTIHTSLDQKQENSGIQHSDPILPITVIPKRAANKKLPEITFSKKPKISSTPEDETLAPKKNSELGKLSFIVSILSTLLFLLAGINFKLAIIFPFVALLAILLGIIALFQKILAPEKWKAHGFAIAGISIGVIVIFLFIKIFLGL